MSFSLGRGFGRVKVAVFGLKERKTFFKKDIEESGKKKRKKVKNSSWSINKGDKTIYFSESFSSQDLHISTLFLDKGSFIRSVFNVEQY